MYFLFSCGPLCNLGWTAVLRILVRSTCICTFPLTINTGTPTQKKNQDAKRNKTEIMKWESEIHELNYELALKGTKQKS